MPGGCAVCGGHVGLMLHTSASGCRGRCRSLMPKRLAWRAALFDMLRLRLFERATRVVALKTKAKQR